jgi:ubiquinone/menaquinone biosynthesis C-methylase UbiE
MRMNTDIKIHYGDSDDLAERIKESLVAAGKDVERITTKDLAPVDEFHIRGRQATLELGKRMELSEASHVLDVGSGLGGPARTLAETFGCRVTGIDLTPSFCAAAGVMSEWLGLSDKVRFIQGDACDLQFEAASFDAALTIHVAMNIPAKDAVYAGVKRVLKPNGVFAVYDVLQGEGGEVVFPVPWAREPSMSHLATPGEMRRLLTEAGFDILVEIDSSDASLAFFQDMMARMAKAGPPPLTFQTFLGGDFPQMARNQVQNLAEKRIHTVTYMCRG